MSLVLIKEACHQRLRATCAKNCQSLRLRISLRVCSRPLSLQLLGERADRPSSPDLALINQLDNGLALSGISIVGEEASSEQALRRGDGGWLVRDGHGDPADGVDSVAELLFAAQELVVAAYAGFVDEEEDPGEVVPAKWY
jgi:hypothetical protein